MFDSGSQTWHIFRLNRSTEQWVDTGTRIDDRPNSLGDALWDGSHLYVASHVVTTSSDHASVASVAGKPARLYRYSYSSSSNSYSLDAGFPANINNNSSESITLDKDSTGRLWATWTQVSGNDSSGYTNAVYVNSTSGNDAAWGSPFVIPVSGNSPAPDDISAVVAYGKAAGVNSIGVMWSNQNDDTVYWATHRDGNDTMTWKGGIAVRGTKQPDDHINLKTLQADTSGRVFAAVKTSLDAAGVPSSSPQVNLLVFKPGTGSWTSSMFGTLSNCHTRPIVMLDDEHSIVHMFATAPTASGCPYAGAAGTIYEKTASMDNPVFPSGRGTPVIRDAASENMNDATSTKQSVNSSTGLVILASNQSTQRYWHADESLGSSTSVPSASFTASPSSGQAPLAVSFTDTSTGNPTSWSWNFGDNTSSSSQNPSHTYTGAGTYTVTHTASNSAGTSSSVSKTVTVSSSPPPTGGSVSAGGSTTAGSAATTGVTLTKPSGTTAGDVLVASFTADGTPNASAPSGWTSFVPRLSPNSGATLFGYYHVVTAGESASSWSWTLDSAMKWNGGMTRYLGVDTTSPIDGSVSTAVNNDTAATSVTVSGVTTSSAGGMVIGGIGADGSSPTTTQPNGWTEAWESTGQQIAEQAYQARTSAGATGSQTWTISAGRALAGWLVALRAK